VPTYSDFVDRLFLNPDLFTKLFPSEPLNWEWSSKIREASDETISGGAPIRDAGMFALVRGALLCAADALDPAHRIFQEDSTSLGSYWHGIMHRREGDFENARHWFRTAGQLPSFGKMQQAAGPESPTMARQETWDPYLFTGMCEQAKFGAHEMTAECVALQRAEFEVLFDYCWRQAVGAS
jgi:hypothetical protein